MYLISGVYDVGNCLVVHCIEKEVDTNGNRKVDTVLVNKNNPRAEECVVGNICRIACYKFDNKWYKFIKFNERG